MGTLRNQLTSPKGGLFLPIEVQKREYSGKLLLAAEMARRGVPVFFGYKQPVIRLALRAEEPGVLLFKSCPGPGTDFFKDLEDRGWLIAAHDEEAGLAWKSFQKFCDYRYSLKRFGELSAYFCWGQDDYEALSQIDPKSEPILKRSGGPRTCLWGDLGRVYFSEKITKIKEVHGPYILFVTNFGTGNPYLNSGAKTAFIRSFRKLQPSDEKHLRDRFNRDTALMRLYLEVIKEISKDDVFNIVVRPHPSENVAAWERALADMDGVSVEAQGDVTPWILAADCVVQNGCASAFEAAAADVPTIALGNSESDVLSGEQCLPNALAIPAIGSNSFKEVLKSKKELWIKGDGRRRSLVRNRAIGAGTLAPIKAISNEIIQLGAPTDARGNEGLTENSVFNLLQKKYRLSRLRFNNTKRLVERAKRPPLEVADIKRDLAKFLEIMDCPEVLDVTPVAANAFRISRRVTR